MPRSKPQFSELLLKANNNTVKSANLFPQPLSINYFISKQCKKDLTALAVEEFVWLTHFNTRIHIVNNYLWMRDALFLI